MVFCRKVQLDDSHPRGWLLLCAHSSLRPLPPLEIAAKIVILFPGLHSTLWQGGSISCTIFSVGSGQRLQRKAPQSPEEEVSPWRVDAQPL